MIGVPGKDLKKWRSAWSAASLGIEIAGCVAVGILAGRWADGKLGTYPWLMMLGLAAGVTAAGRAVYRIVKAETRGDGEESGSDERE